MTDYDEKKTQLLIDQKLCCGHCGKKFTESDKIELAHKLRSDKPNNEMFSPLVVDHVLNLVATHKDCNSSVLINRSTKPIQAYEHIVDILSHILLEDPSIFDYAKLLKAFDNIDKDKIVNTISKAQYEILDNFFIKYRAI